MKVSRDGGNFEGKGSEAGKVWTETCKEILHVIWKEKNVDGVETGCVGLQVVGAELERRRRDDGYRCGARANEKLVGKTRITEVDASPERGRIEGYLPPLSADLRPCETVFGPAMAVEPGDADGKDGFEDLIGEGGDGEKGVEVCAD